MICIEMAHVVDDATSRRVILGGQALAVREHDKQDSITVWHATNSTDRASVEKQRQSTKGGLFDLQPGRLEKSSLAQHRSGLKEQTVLQLRNSYELCSAVSHCSDTEQLINIKGAGTVPFKSLYI
jgi:hypothetical protein